MKYEFVCHDSRCSQKVYVETDGRFAVLPLVRCVRCSDARWNNSMQQLAAKARARDAAGRFSPADPEPWGTCLIGAAHADDS